MRRTAFLLSLLAVALLGVALLAAPAFTAPTQERRVALVIGNGTYKAGPLKNPPNDARDMASALKSVGFEVILRENASLRQMNEAIDQFWNSLKRGGVGLFFFAGHGVQVAGENFLVPVDARIALEKDVQYECVNAGKVLGRMEDAGNGLNIVILDACRNNPFARSFRSESRGLAKMDAPSGSLVAFATAPGDVAADGTGKNGLYTSHLLKHLRTPGLTIERVLKQTRIGVAEESAKLGKRQTPWESSSLMGDFYFNQQDGQAVSPPAAQALAAAPTPVSAPAAAPVPVPVPVSAQPVQPAAQAAAQAAFKPLQDFFSAAPGGQQPVASVATSRPRPGPAAAPASPPTALASLPAASASNRFDARRDNLAQAQAITDARNNPPRAWLGVELADVTAEAAKAKGLGATSGALVQGTLPGSPGQAAGLLPGDVVLAVNGQTVDKPATMVAFIGSRQPGETVQIDIWRDRQKMRAVAELTTPPPQASPLAGLKVRLIYTDDRLADAQTAQRTLQAQGMTVEMFHFVKNDSYRGHIGKLYAVEGFGQLAPRVAELIRPVESVSIFPNPVKASDGQQFNLWIAR
jgi:membrane-associated protease RseP (regulator of RpoE activity)